jgi:hypothetical protein
LVRYIMKEYTGKETMPSTLPPSEKEIDSGTLNL